MTCELLTNVVNKIVGETTECNERCKKVGECPFVNGDLFFPKVGIEEPHHLEVSEEEITKRTIGIAPPTENIIKLIEGKGRDEDR